eukprot:814526-Rhodomonas_salina.2
MRCSVLRQRTALPGRADSAPQRRAHVRGTPQEASRTPQPFPVPKRHVPRHHARMQRCREGHGRVYGEGRMGSGHGPRHARVCQVESCCHGAAVTTAVNNEQMLWGSVSRS